MTGILRQRSRRAGRLVHWALGLAALTMIAAGAAAADDLGNDSCLECHSDDELTTERDGRTVPLYVDGKAFAGSVHGDLDCVSCHADIEAVPHPERLQPVDCSVCHDGVAEQYAASLHGQKRAAGDTDAPGCAACHGVHDIAPVKSPRSRVSRMSVARVCIDCHIDEAVTERHEGSMPRPETIKAYAKSVHGRGLFESGLSVSAVCTDCHGAHSVEPADDPRSPAYRANIPSLCGRCHPDIASVYRESIHGQAVSRGIQEAPVCTDCHGEHTIAAPSDPNSKVAARNIPRTCAACHESEALARKFGLPFHTYSTYLSSYHGVVNRYGDAAVANCASCHGVHNILPSSDPRSSIAPGNLGKTCGTCHPGVGDRLAGVKVHVEASPDSSKGMYYVRTFYTWFIGVLMACFLIYMGIDIYGSIRRRAQR